MTTNRIPQLAPTLFITALAACANPKRVNEEPITIMRNGQRVEMPARATDDATSRSLEATLRGRESRDSVGPVALVQLSGGGVSSLTYREPQGLRTVSSVADVADAGRARADALVREGDALAAAGDFTAALERYDRASVVSRADAELQYKMATSLDKLLRPIEASLRYRLFLHQLELQKIEAVGNANAKLAEAIAHARERIVVLDKRSR